jgi:TonB family protein
VHSQSQGGEGTPEAAYVPPKQGSGEGIPTAAPATPEPARTAPPETGPVKIEDSDFIHKVQPEYPEMAKEQNIQGTVIVLITIGPSGSVVSASIAESSGNAALDKAALQAAQESTFRPPLANGIPTTRQYKIEYDFQLD